MIQDFKLLSLRQNISDTITKDLKLVFQISYF